MRYDWRDPITAATGTREYFSEIDRRFFESANKYLPSKIPFDSLIHFERLSNADVLEVGVGHGSHAHLLSTYSRTFTGIDLTSCAAEMTKKRFELFGLRGRILQMDAEKLEFPDASFDFVWSWGVIHHSSNTPLILREIHRVLRPSGSAIVMVYHRSFWKYYVESGLFRGIFRGDWLRYRSLRRIVQHSADGALARYYTCKEFKRICEGLFDLECEIYGQKNELLPLPAGGLKNSLEKALPDSFGRFCLTSLRWGTFLVAKLTKAP